VSSPTRPAGAGAVTPGQLLAWLLLDTVVLWLLSPFAGVDPPGRLTVSNAPWTDEGFNLANARERVLTGRFATGDVDRSLTNGAYSALAAATFAVTGPSLAAGRALSMVAVAVAVLLLAVGLARPLGRPAALLAAVALGGANLVLEHGRLALVEAIVVVLLAGALVLATRAAWRPSLAAGAGVGLLVAAAVSVKAIALLPGMMMLAVVLVATQAAVQTPAGAVLFVAVLGVAAFATVAPLQMRVLDKAAGAGQNLASSLNIAAFNLGNALGAWVGGVVIGREPGLAALGWAAALLTVAGVALALVSRGLERRSAAQAPCTAAAA